MPLASLPLRRPSLHRPALRGFANLLLAVSSLAAVALSGCSSGFTSERSTASSAGLALTGGVHGGQQPVTGAKVYLYAAGATGVGSAARSMLAAPGYVVTDGSGSFSITGDYTCQPNDMVYLVALGGNPGLAAGTNNPALSLEAALGACSALTPLTRVQINEVTTVAMVYALNGFQYGYGFVGAGSSTQAQTGLRNAFAMAATLVSVTTGQAALDDPRAAAEVPQAEINSLANSIAPCVNSTGVGAPCSTLFATVAPTGGQPSDTVGALATIAYTPLANPSGIFGLTTANAPFQPALTKAPSDWTVAVIMGQGSNLHPSGVAIDAFGNAWFANTNANSIVELSPTGTQFTPPAGYTGGGVNQPLAVAIDDSGNVWAANYGSGSGTLTKLSAFGTPLSPSTGFTNPTVSYGLGLAIDGPGNVWLFGDSMAKYNNAGTVISTPPFIFIRNSAGIAIDASNDLWATQSTNESRELPDGSAVQSYVVNGFQNTAIAINGTSVWTAGRDSVTITDLNGVQTSRPGGLGGGGINYAISMAVDGYGSTYILNQGGANNTNHYAANNVTEFYSNGVNANPYSSPGFMSSRMLYPTGIAVDPSGNVWVSDAGAGAIVFVGLGNPTVTPIASAVKANKLGALP